MRNKKNECLIFLLITYGFVVVMAIPMAIFFFQGKDLTVFAYAQMLYPAAGLMVSKLLCNKDDPTIPKTFFLGYLVFTALIIIRCLITEGPSLTAMIFAGSVVLAIFLLAEKGENISAHQLSGGNWKQSLQILLLFLAIILGSNFMCMVTSEGFFDTVQIISESNLLAAMLMIPVSFVLGFPFYLGEEYGWRTYFQPLLQKKFGLIQGVFVFGFLWELWHLPLVFFYYSPQDSHLTLLQFILFRYVNVILIAIFMAFAYMMTQNIWLPVFLHCANNVIAGSDVWNTGSEELSWAALGLNILIYAAFYLPILRAKVFRSGCQGVMKETETI